jgi:para-nitrobenzyl esterase
MPCLPARRGGFALSVVLCAFASTTCDRDAAPRERPEAVASITSGTVRGALPSTGGAEFLGIPFAAPPVGPRRWQPPEPAARWSGVKDATTFGPPCMQPVLGDWNRTDAEKGKEDCLYLNVMTPQWPPAKPLPVMLWIHGGANMGGTASSEFFGGGGLPGRGVVLVTTNYRLGIFGFFAHEQLSSASEHHSSGNYALLDQIAALRWVHDNIAQFGGDPDNITVFGQSAGAISISALMTSPLATGLFHKAISESGSITLHPARLADLEAANERWVRSLPIPKNRSPLAYLRRLGAAELLKAASDGRAPRPEIALDGWVLTHEPAQVFFWGQEAPVPMIIGNNSREIPITESADQVRRNIEKSAAQDMVPRLLAAYGLANGGRGAADDPTIGPLSVQFIVDVQFRCTGTLQQAWHEAAHHPSYGYQFDRAIPGHEAEGALHSGELPYVFGSFPEVGNIGGPFGEADRRLSDVIQRYWTSFARTGNPNATGLPEWPRVNGTGGYMEFMPDGRAVAKIGLRKAQCDLFREAVEREPMYAAAH